MKPKHGRELREFWRIQKAKYRERKKAKEATIEGETSKAPDPTTQERGEPKNESI
jgi:hypothetical protein